MHLEAAGEGPTNQVLQTHKSVAAHLLLCCYSVLDVLWRRTSGWVYPRFSFS